MTPLAPERHFGLRARPFALPPQDAAFVSLTPTCDALARLCEAVQKGDGIAMLTAPPGAGKTVVCRALRAALADQFEVVLLAGGTFPTRRSLLQAILNELGHEIRGRSEQELRLELLSRAQQATEARNGIVILVDEAHQLSSRLLDDLRGLTNHIHHGHMMVRVVLAGQLLLEEQLTAAPLQALNSRISSHATIEPLTLQDSAEYIGARVRHVGGDPSALFAPEALEAICRTCDGNPRCLNQLCDEALSQAARAGQTRVTVEDVRRAFTVLRQLPTHWNETLCGSDLVGSDDTEPPLPVDASFVHETQADQVGDAGTVPAAMPLPEWSRPVSAIEFGSDDATDSMVRPQSLLSTMESLSTRAGSGGWEPLVADDGDLTDDAALLSEFLPEMADDLCACSDDVACSQEVARFPEWTTPEITLSSGEAAVLESLEEFVVEDRYARLDQQFSYWNGLVESEMAERPSRPAAAPTSPPVASSASPPAGEAPGEETWLTDLDQPSLMRYAELSPSAAPGMDSAPDAAGENEAAVRLETSGHQSRVFPSHSGQWQFHGDPLTYDPVHPGDTDSRDVSLIAERTLDSRTPHEPCNSACDSNLQPNGPRQSRESLDRLLADAGAVSTDAADDKTLQGGNDSQPRKYARLFSRIRKRDLNRPVTHIP